MCSWLSGQAQICCWFVGSQKLLKSTGGSRGKCVPSPDIKPKLDLMGRTLNESGVRTFEFQHLHQPYDLEPTCLMAQQSHLEDKRRNTYASIFKVEDTKVLQMNVLETVCLLAKSRP